MIQCLDTNLILFKLYHFIVGYKILKFELN